MDCRERAKQTGVEARLRARKGQITGSNTGLANGVYCNLAVLPKAYAADFEQFCARNFVCLPLLEQIPAGTHSSMLAKDSDVSTDVPRYNIYEDEKLRRTGVDNVLAEWSPDHVGFLLGCSFTIETALADANLTPRNTLEGKTPPTFVTTVPLMPSGIFHGFVVVTMRWYRPDDVDQVRAVSRRFSTQHGEPVAWGWDGAETLGVKGKLLQQKVDFGEWSEPRGDEVPVFWGCGVTAEHSIQASKVPGVAITHVPGSMFVTDVLAEDLETRRARQNSLV